MGIFDSADPAALLVDAFDQRKIRNPSYSLRAFARDIGLDSSRLSLILKRKQGLSLDRARVVATKLGMTERETEFFLCLCEAHFARSQVVRGTAITRLMEFKKASEWVALNETVFERINTPHHLAVREMLSLEDFDPDPEALSKALGLSPENCREIWQDLLDQGLISFDATKSRWSSLPNVSKKYAGASGDVVHYHRLTLEHARDALASVNHAERDVSSILFPFHAANMVEAQRIIREFRRGFEGNFVAGARDYDQVYCLAIQLFPMTKAIAPKDAQRVKPEHIETQLAAAPR